MGSCNHQHHHTRNNNMMFYAAAFIALFGVAEAVCGTWSGSLALLSDAGHMGADALAMLIAGFASWVGRRPATPKHTYGFGRIEVIASWISSLLLLITIGGILIEAFHRWHNPPAIASMPVMIVATLGLFVNVVTVWLLNQGEENINTKAALLHVFGDLLGSVAALTSGIVIYYTNWTKIDPLLSGFICLLILISTISLLKESAMILMEGTPSNIDTAQIELLIKNIDGVNTIHDLHVWTLTSGKIILTAHVVITDHKNWPQLTDDIRTTLHKEFGIAHSTIQVETIDQKAPCLDCYNR